MSRHRTVFSTSEAYFDAARQELAAAFAGARVERLGADTGRLDTAGADIREVATACRRRPIVFVRHLMREVETIPLTGTADDIDRVCEAAVAVVNSRAVPPDLALQVWASSGASPTGFRTDELWRRAAGRLSRLGVTVTRANQDQSLSLCATPLGVVIGLNHREDALTDWPGGRVGLARDTDQISRAELKLDELFKVFDLALPAGGLALDLGASPGGWTRVLRRRGFTVWAIDPAALDARLAADPAIHHVRTTAGPFLAGTDRTFDLVVNDMRMVPGLSCRVMLAAAARQKPGGLAIMTLKISPHDPLPTVDAALHTLKQSYDILHARQLYHNRNEVTIVARRRASASRSDEGRRTAGAAGSRARSPGHQAANAGGGERWFDDPGEAR